MFHLSNVFQFDAKAFNSLNNKESKKYLHIFSNKTKSMNHCKHLLPSGRKQILNTGKLPFLLEKINGITSDFSTFNFWKQNKNKKKHFHMYVQNAPEMCFHFESRKGFRIITDISSSWFFYMLQVLMISLKIPPQACSSGASTKSPISSSREVRCKSVG